jgi:CNT family concentrative nucleoside transporter
MAQSLLGLIAFPLLAWLLSENRRRVRVRIVAGGLGLQLVLAVLLLRVPVFSSVFTLLNRVVMALEEATRAGTTTVFGFLGGGPVPYQETIAGSTFTLAFRGLPIVLVISALSALLFHWRILPVVVRGFSRVLERTFGIGGAEGVGVSANILVGMVEAPLLVRPYLAAMTRSELFSLMAVGMATIAGTVMVLYATILGGTVPDAMGHILAASVLSAPAAVMMAKLMVPEDASVTRGEVAVEDETRSAMDAITKGTLQGIELVLQIVGMIIVLVAFVQLINIGLRLLPGVGGSALTLQRLLGWVMAPVVWLVGIPWRECATAGSLMGTKTVLNELLAYLDLASVPAGELSERSRVVLLYALCGFANPGSLGIMIGGMGAMAPGRRSEIVALGMRSIVAGTLAACMTGAVAGLFIR